MSDHIDYRDLLHQAFRNLVVEVLSRVAEDGLPGDHHFYLTFDTRHPGVDISDAIRARYPEDMTIVIQHQFYDFAVTPERFSVRLEFGGVPETLVVPFDALTVFVDPSENFGLRLKPSEDDEPALGSMGESDDSHGFVVEDGEPAQAEASGDAEIVSLDTFRKT